MFVIRPRPIIENRVQRIELAGIRIEPRINVLSLDWNDAAIVFSCGNFPRRLVRHLGERIE